MSGDYQSICDKIFEGKLPLFIVTQFKFYQNIFLQKQTVSDIQAWIARLPFPSIFFFIIVKHVLLFLNEVFQLSHTFPRYTVPSNLGNAC